MDFGRVALAGAFVKPEEFADERKYDLTLEFCEACLLLQVGQQVPAVTLFDNYFYFSSATETMRRHFEQYARDIVKHFHPNRVLEIGCNDGVLMNPLKALGVSVVGVDPARNVTDAGVINAYWGMEVARDLGRFDLILANNVFAHIADINGACAAVRQALQEDGTFIFEVNRLDSLIYDLQYDWVYHEHLFYYSLLALDNLLARHDLMIYDLLRLGTHAGSMRYFACRKRERPETAAVHRQRDDERWLKLHRVERFHTFADQAEDHRHALRMLVQNSGRVAGYGACGRTNTMLQFCGLDSRNIDFIVDDAPAKQGFYTPGSHIPIAPATRLAEQPDCLIVFAWSFLQEIQPKLKSYAGKVVIPLPSIVHQREARAA